MKMANEDGETRRGATQRRAGAEEEIDEESNQ
jgi:hypothetical protein